MDSTPKPKPPGTGPPHKLDELGALRALLHAVRRRIVGGLVLALPIVLTIWIVYWLYSTIKLWVLDPGARLVIRVFGSDYLKFTGAPAWWDRAVAPAIAVGLMLAVLYLLGYVLNTRLYRAFDAILLRVPVVTTIYQAIRGVFQSLEGPATGARFKRVVLVEFPHPGMRALAFVTKSLRDEATGRTVLCVCVLTGVMPPAGFTLFVPEEDVTEVDWSVNQTLQAILSGGLSAPASIRYFGGDGPRPHAAAGPIVDAQGLPIESHAEARGPAEG